MSEEGAAATVCQAKEGPVRNPLSFIIGLKGQAHVGINTPGMTLVDGRSYLRAGRNLAVGSDGRSYVRVGNLAFSSAGSTHTAFGGNPRSVL